MSGELSVDTELVQTSAASFNDLSERVRRITNNLSTVVDEVGPCWGDDNTGKQFAAQYQSPASQTLEGFTGVGDAFSGTGQGLGTMAAGFTVTEDANARAARGAAPRA